MATQKPGLNSDEYLGEVAKLQIRRSEVLAEIEACRRRWPGGFSEITKQLTETRSDKFPGMTSRTFSSLLLFWSASTATVLGVVGVVGSAILTFPLIGILPVGENRINLVAIVLAGIGLPTITKLCSDDAFARGSRLIEKAGTTMRWFLVYGSILASFLMFVAWVAGYIDETSRIITHDVDAIYVQFLGLLLAFVGLAMTPPLLVVHKDQAQVQPMHSACTALCVSLMVLMAIVLFWFSKSSPTGEVSLALFFAATTWLLIQLGSARKDIGDSYSKTLEILTELDGSFGVVRFEGAGPLYSADQRRCILALQALTHTPLPPLVPGMKGRPRADHAIGVTVDYLAMAIAGDRPSLRVAVREEFFANRIGAASREDIQYLASDFMTVLRVKCLSKKAAV